MHWLRSALRNDFRKAVVLTTDNVKVYGIVDMATFIRKMGWIPLLKMTIWNSC